MSTLLTFRRWARDMIVSLACNLDLGEPQVVPMRGKSQNFAKFSPRCCNYQKTLERQPSQYSEVWACRSLRTCLRGNACILVEVGWPWNLPGLISPAPVSPSPWFTTPSGLPLISCDILKLTSFNLRFFTFKMEMVVSKTQNIKCNIYKMLRWYKMVSHNLILKDQ